MSFGGGEVLLNGEGSAGYVVAGFEVDSGAAIVEVLCMF
jgi:hypothetical protein